MFDYYTEFIKICLETPRPHRKAHHIISAEVYKSVYLVEVENQGVIYKYIYPRAHIYHIIRFSVMCT